jgi:hypothetical protein
MAYANGVSIYYQRLPCGARARKFAREEIAELTIAFTKKGYSWRIGLNLYGRQILLP